MHIISLATIYYRTLCVILTQTGTFINYVSMLFSRFMSSIPSLWLSSILISASFNSVQYTLQLYYNSHVQSQAKRML